MKQRKPPDPEEIARRVKNMKKRACEEGVTRLNEDFFVLQDNSSDESGGKQLRDK